MSIKPNQIGLQLYTVREYLTDEKTAMTMLNEVRNIGYETIQLCNSPFDAKFYKNAMDEFGFTICGMDAPMAKMQNDLDGVIENCKILGNSYITGSFNTYKFGTENHGAQSDLADDMDKFIRDICIIGEKLKGTGVSFAYHNHSFEFAVENGKSFLEDFYDRTKNAGILAEIDTYWVQHGGGSPQDWIYKLAGRIPILHLKDMLIQFNEKTEVVQKFAPVGSGNMHWEPVIQAGEQTGVKWFVVEQDTFDKPSLECAKDSFDYLTKLING